MAEINTAPLGPGPNGETQTAPWRGESDYANSVADERWKEASIAALVKAKAAQSAGAMAIKKGSAKSKAQKRYGGGEEE